MSNANKGARKRLFLDDEHPSNTAKKGKGKSKVVKVDLVAERQNMAANKGGDINRNKSKVVTKFKPIFEKPITRTTTGAIKKSFAKVVNEWSKIE